MKSRVSTLIAMAALICLIPAASFGQITAFTQDFEGLTATDPDALGNDGWVVYASVFEAGSGNWLYGYGTFPAPNNPSAPAFCNIVVGEGGLEQGDQQLSVFSDYENAGAHIAGDMIEANVFKEFTIGAADVGKTWTFTFESKKGNLEIPSTALAFIKTIDPANNYNMTNFVTADMTNTTTDWDAYTLELLIDAGLVGQLFQVGFSNNCTLYASSSIIYDNLVLSDTGGSGGPNGILAYSQDFESLIVADVDALGNDGWFAFGSVFAAGTGDFLYSYGTFPAPNNPAAPAFCSITTGEGGAEQGAQQLNVFSDYENASAHIAGDIIEASVFQEQTIGSDDIGKTWVFDFEAKMPTFGGVTPPSTATAFIKTLDPANGYATTNHVTADMTAIGGEWSGYTLSLTIDAGLVGQIFQIGFSNTATNYEPSAIIYDNVDLHENDASAVPEGSIMFDATLRQNYPNPFNPSTRIGFALDNPGHVNLTVYDIAGRQIANLVSGSMPAGDHVVTWNGQTRSGSPAPSGQYFYVMKTANGQVSRSMVLLK